MDLILNPVELVRRYNAFVYGPNVPKEAAEALQTIPGVHADVIGEGAEILYAHYDLLNEEGKTILGQLTAYGVSQGWSSLNRDGRWEKIRDAVRRDLGDDGDWLDPADDPAPQVQRRAEQPAAIEQPAKVKGRA